MTAIYRLRLDENLGCIPPNCNAELASDQNTKEHHDLARTAATASVTLLKNNDELLPLDAGHIKRIALLGVAASAAAGDISGGSFAGDVDSGDYYAGGGSGHVMPKLESVVTPREGILRRATAAGIELVFAADNGVDAAKEAAKSADAVVFVGATSCTEGFDRPSLHLDHDADHIITEVAGIRPTVVLMQTPGTVLTP